MSTLGNSTNPASGWLFPGSGYAAASSYTTPSGGGILISTLHGYLATPSGASTGYLCVWDNSGNLLASVNIGALPSGTQSAGGQSWLSGNLASPLYVAPSTPIWIGFYATGNIVFSTESAGTSNDKLMGGSAPGSFSGSASTGQAEVGAYADYTPGGIARINTGTPSAPVWTAGVVRVWNGSAWVNARVRVNTGTPTAPVWTDAT